VFCGHFSFISYRFDVISAFAIAENGGMTISASIRGDIVMRPLKAHPSSKERQGVLYISIKGTVLAVHMLKDQEEGTESCLPTNSLDCFNQYFNIYALIQQFRLPCH
jgi:hypothetical protein